MSAFRKLIYVSEDSYVNIKVNHITTVLSALTIGFSLAILALFVLIFFNLAGVVEGLGDRTHMIVYAGEGAPGTVKSMKETLEKVRGVDRVDYVSPESALKSLKEELKEHEAVFEGVNSSIFPRSFDIMLAKEERTPEKIDEISEDFKKVSWVSEVQHGREWAEKFSSFLGFAKLAVMVFGSFLTAAVLFIISNTIRLNIYSRRAEIEVARLLGATDLYIRTPFLLEGLFIGFLGGFFAIFLLAIARYAIEAKVPPYLGFVMDNPFSFLSLLAALVVSGMLIGFFGSLFSLGRFLKQ